MKIYSDKEIDTLPEKWIPCSDCLPPVGIEVIVQTNTKVTALARFIPHENSPPERGWWDNAYPGKWNAHLFDSVLAWMPMPKGCV